MDAGMAIKPVVSVVSPHAQPAIAIAPAVPTVLVAAKAVAPVVNAAPARNEPRQTPPDRTTRDAIIDPQTREVVFRLLDARTRQVIHQVPDRAFLRAQAYASAEAARALAKGQNPNATASPDTNSVDTLT